MFSTMSENLPMAQETESLNKTGWGRDYELALRATGAFQVSIMYLLSNCS
jgi:hypothetical protein